MKNIFGIMLALLLVTPDEAPSNSAQFASEVAFCSGVYYSLSDQSGETETGKRFINLADRLEDLAIGIEPTNSNILALKILNVRKSLNEFNDAGISVPLTHGQLSCNFLTSRIVELATGELTIEEYYEKYGHISQAEF